MKFSKTGKFIKAWGKKGNAAGEFDTPHAIAVDSQERVYVADRSNDRVQVFDANGKLLAEWKQFGRPSGIYVDANDVVYVADSQTVDKAGCTTDQGCRRGIRVGNAADGAVKYSYRVPRAMRSTRGRVGRCAGRCMARRTRASGLIGSLGSKIGLRPATRRGIVLALPPDSGAEPLQSYPFCPRRMSAPG